MLVSHGRLSEVARARLEVMSRTGDGFVIAEKDLEIRGPGDFFGTRQWGLPNLRIGNLVRDRDLSRDVVRRVMRAAGAESVADLRRLSVKQLLRAQRAVLNATDFGDPLFGPVVGAFFMVTLENYLTTIGQWVFVVQGVIFVVCVLLFRRGIVGELSHLLRIRL